MNIKEIALKLGEQIYGTKFYAGYPSGNRLIDFAEALVAELAKKNEPVAWLSRESESGRICLDVEDSGESGTWSPSFPVYELPPTAEQIEQETAEAIAKMLDDKDVERTDYCMHVYEEGELYKSEVIAAVRSGAWKEYK